MRLDVRGDCGGRRTWIRGGLLLLTVTAAVALGAPAVATAGPPIPGQDLPGPDPVPKHPHTYLVVTMNFKGGYSTPRSIPDRKTQELADHIRTTVNPWFAEASHGLYGDHTTARLGPITVQPKQELCSGEWRSEVIGLADAEVRKRALEPSDYAAAIYYFTEFSQCDWDGAANYPEHGNQVLLNGNSSQLTLTHELGHTLGLGHAGAMFCADANGNRVPVSPVIPFGTCTQREYGNDWSAMGNHDALSYTSAQLAQLGWNAGRVATISNDTPPTTKLIAPLEDNVAGSTQAIHLIDDGLWLEYLKNIQDFPSGPRNGGLLVSTERPFVTPPPTLHAAPFLLDMTPGDGDWGRRENEPWSPRMLVGQSWSNPNGNLKITLNSQNDSGASVTIESKVTYKTVPDLRDKTVVNAEGAITAAGLTVAVETPKVDPSCARLGQVLTQSPARGTRTPAGSPVSFEYGIKPRGGCPIPP